MTRKYRLVLIGLSLITLLIVGRTITGSFSFILGQFWFTSGLLLLILLSLIDQPHFSKDSNIFVNGVTAGVSLLLVDSVDRDFVYWLFFSVTIYLLLSSYSLLWLRQRSLSEENKGIQLLSRLNREIGKPEAIFSAFFIWGAYKQFGASSNQFNALLVYWVVFTVLNIPSLSRAIENFLTKNPNKLRDQSIGEIFGVKSKNTFLVKLFPERFNSPNIDIFDYVEFRRGSRNKALYGLIIDDYILDQERWVKVLSSPSIDNIFIGSEEIKGKARETIYRIEKVPENDFLGRFVGIVTEGSKINHLRFVYNSKLLISEGQLLGVSVGESTVLYQVVEGVTQVESLEKQNETGLIIGEAVQLGTWSNKRLQFEQFGWVPEVNTPVFLASNIDRPKVNPNEVVVGYIPETDYPVILNKHLAMSHHMAVIGVTGTGKSVFSRDLIRKFLEEDDTKVICIDFTGEYQDKFSDLGVQPAIEQSVADDLFKEIDLIEREMGGNYNRDTDKSRASKKKVSGTIAKELKKFLEGDTQLAIFELPHVENTSGVLTYTKVFFTVLFHIAKKEKNYGKRLSLVLEEAHTIVPESNFSGVSDKASQGLLNSIAQIALQGRKYNIGLLVIAQRTANVSKTILTQCNTIVSFQEFDKTSNDFLANYFGPDIVKSLPKLRFREAIAAGKAFRSSVPMIFKVPEIEEKDK